MTDHFHDVHAAATFRDDKLSKVNLHESQHMFCDVYCLRPGQLQKIHAHAGSDKIYHALSGSTLVTIGVLTRELAPGGLAIAPAGVPHGVENVSDAEATLLVVMAPHSSFEG